MRLARTLRSSFSRCRCGSYSVSGQERGDDLPRPVGVPSIVASISFRARNRSIQGGGQRCGLVAPQLGVCSGRRRSCTRIRRLAERLDHQNSTAFEAQAARHSAAVQPEMAVLVVRHDLNGANTELRACCPACWRAIDPDLIAHRATYSMSPGPWLRAHGPGACCLYTTILRRSKQLPGVREIGHASNTDPDWLRTWRSLRAAVVVTAQARNQ